MDMKDGGWRMEDGGWRTISISVTGQPILDKDCIQTGQEGVIVQALQVITGVGGLQVKHVKYE